MDINLFKTEEAYFDAKAISASQIKSFDKSPYYFWKQTPFNPCRKETKETDALMFGKLVHCLLLEPEEFKKRFKVVNFGLSRKNQKYALLKNKFPDKILINEFEYEKANTMLAQLRNHRLARAIIAGAKTEVPFSWTDEKTGLPCKCKVDAYKKTKNGYVIIDYKTSSDIESLLKYPQKFQYPLQDAFYRKGLKARFGEEPIEFAFIIQSTVEDEADVIAVANVNYDSFLYARDIVDTHMLTISDKLKQFEKTKDESIWAMYPERVEMAYSSGYLLKGY